MVSARAAAAVALLLCAAPAAQGAVVVARITSWHNPRAGPGNATNGNGSAALKTLVITPGTLAPTFSPSLFNYTLAVSPSCTYISCSATAGSSSDNVTIDQHEAPGGTNTVRADFLFSRRIPVPPRENSSVCPWSRSPDAHRRPS